MTSPSTLLFTFVCMAFFYLFLGLSEAAVTCGTDGVCRDTPKNGKGTVCKNCKSCTFKNCCNKVFTSPYFKCHIKGWKDKSYIGNVRVSITDVGCSDSSRCPDGSKCVAYEKSDSTGICMKSDNSWFGLAAAIAALVYLAPYVETSN
uniref:UPAR/Ly6 domain-containing protein n=1 Tax=Globodera pallida TaxID=36090 RepID=A0A183C1U5_GLOPA